ncbi:MAG: hypothetical protein ACK40M_11780, partial [Flavobacteriales bacterium]
SDVEVVNLFLTVSVSTETFVGMVTPVVLSTTIATEKVAVVGDPPTDLNLHPNSPGYRLILNNILFPAAKKKKQKT